MLNHAQVEAKKPAAPFPRPNLRPVLKAKAGAQQSAAFGPGGQQQGEQAPGSEADNDHAEPDLKRAKHVEASSGSLKGEHGERQAGVKSLAAEVRDREKGDGGGLAGLLGDYGSESEDEDS